jgi:hypothetical protein
MKAKGGVWESAFTSSAKKMAQPAGWARERCEIGGKILSSYLDDLIGLGAFLSLGDFEFDRVTLLQGFKSFTLDG